MKITHGRGFCVFSLTALAVWAAAACAAEPAGDPGETPPIAEAHWIWSSPGGMAESGPVAYFRRKFALSDPVAEAVILITADNGYELYVNNRRVAAKLGYGGDVWGTLDRFRLDTLLHPGANVIAIRGESLGGSAGVLAAVLLRTADGERQVFCTDAEWRATATPADDNWGEPDHNDSQWGSAAPLTAFGGAPWGALAVPERLTDPETLRVDASIPGRPHQPRADRFTEPGEAFAWPAGIVYVAGRGPVHSTPAQQAVWDVHGTRATFENDIPGPVATGFRLCVLTPTGPGGAPRVIVDAGAGLIGSPAVCFAGEEIVFAMAPEGGKFFHLYSVRPDGTELTQLTEGPWHDYDPAFLGDGRIVFASTRIGSRDEYHANTARSLFILDADRQSIQPLTYHIVADSEPALMADGRIAFVRHDNFMERAKVESRIHAVRPDGAGGMTLLGPDRGLVRYDRATGAEYPDLWLRNHGFGSPAPLPDGRLAALTSFGPMITDVFLRAHAETSRMPSDVTLYDIAPLPDNRLLCSTQAGVLGVLEPETGAVTELVRSDEPLHSAAYLGPRPAPADVYRFADDREETDDPMGYLFCQSVFHTHQTEADWARVRAIRVFEGRPLTLRAAHHQYGHIGVEAVELGTAPLAPDGSFHVRIPADRAVALQAVDAEGRAVVSEMSWIYVRPGERLSCVGCHAPRQQAPEFRGARIGASLAPPVDLTGQGLPHRFRGNNAANGGILNLQFDRFRESASLDLYRQSLVADDAQLAALPPGRATEVQALTAALRDGIAGERIGAARRLAIFRDRAAVPALCDALEAPDLAVRLAAAQALAACGDRAAVPALLEALTDRNAHVAQAAHIALAHLTGLDVDFDGYAAPDDRARQAAGWRARLDAPDWDAIEDGCIARLAATDPSEAQLAAEALGHIGSARAAAALRAYVESNVEHGLTARLAALRAIGHLRGEASIPLLARILRENTERTPVAPPHSHEFGWAAAPDHLAAAAAEALGWIATEAAETALIEAFAELVEFWYYTHRAGDHEWLMGCHASPVHYRILEALDAIGSRRASPIAGAILRSVPMDPDRGLFYEADSYETLAARVVHRSGLGRSAVETCLSVIGDPAAVPVEELRDAVTASPPAVSVGALCAASRAAHLLSVLALHPADGPRVAAAFERYRAGDASRTKSWTCFFLARTLGKLEASDAVPALLAALEEPNEASYGIPDPPNVFLHDALTPLYRAAAADALGRIGRHEAAPALLAATADFGNAMDVRQAAAEALRRLADPATLEALRALAADYPEVATRRSLLAAVRAMDTPTGE